MKVHADLSAVKRSRWYEILLRFFFGGVITVITGILAKKFGPAVGGLFLAFPAIFPASATLIEKHEKEKKDSAGIDGTNRSRAIAAADAAGATMGALGLAAFAVIVWKLLPAHASSAVLAAAIVGWLCVAVATWTACDHLRVLRRARRSHAMSSDGDLDRSKQSKGQVRLT